MNQFFIYLVVGFLTLSSLHHPASTIEPVEATQPALARGAFVNGLPSAQDKTGTDLVPQPIKRDNLSRGVVTSAKSALLLDLNSGKTLFAKGVDKILPIASITKLMSAVVLEDLINDWQQSVTFSSEDRVGGNLANFYFGEAVKLEELFKVALIDSDNDAITALVRSTGLSADQFVAKMNAKAIELGMAETMFVDPTGLGQNNQSSVYDTALLVHQAMQSDRIRQSVSTRRYQYQAGNRTGYVRNTNYLLDSFLNAPPFQIVGGKTGFILESGYNLAVEVRNQEVALLAVVFGSDSSEARFEEVKSLVSWAFDNWQWPAQLSYQRSVSPQKPEKVTAAAIN